MPHKVDERDDILNSLEMKNFELAKVFRKYRKLQKNKMKIQSNEEGEIDPKYDRILIKGYYKHKALLHEILENSGKLKKEIERLENFFTETEEEKKRKEHIGGIIGKHDEKIFRDALGELFETGEPFKNQAWEIVLNDLAIASLTLFEESMKKLRGEEKSTISSIGVKKSKNVGLIDYTFRHNAEFNTYIRLKLDFKIKEFFIRHKKTRFCKKKCKKSKDESTGKTIIVMSAKELTTHILEQLGGTDSILLESERMYLDHLEEIRVKKEE